MAIFDRYDIVFQEIPNEVSLAFTMKGCINNCDGCHSPHLRETTGEELTFDTFHSILKKYRNQITCVLFLGDSYKSDVIHLCKIAQIYGLKCAVYSGRDVIDSDFVKVLDYYKIGRYDKEFGGLNERTTNQILYKVENGRIMDITNLFWK